MKTLAIITSVICIILGVLFILAMRSDIQLGFGLVLFAQGLIALTSTKS